LTALSFSGEKRGVTSTRRSTENGSVQMRRSPVNLTGTPPRMQTMPTPSPVCSTRTTSEP
jgi:hypothetical protein